MNFSLPNGKRIPRYMMWQQERRLKVLRKIKRGKIDYLYLIDVRFTNPVEGDHTKSALESDRVLYYHLHLRSTFLAQHPDLIFLDWSGLDDYGIDHFLASSDISSEMDLFLKHKDVEFCSTSVTLRGKVDPEKASTDPVFFPKKTKKGAIAQVAKFL